MSKAKLYQKVAKVMSQVERVPKRGYNNFHKYEYVMESDLVDHVRKFMVDAGLVVFNSIKEYEINGDHAVAVVEFTLCDTETGETMVTSFPFEGNDKGDKKFPKILASATKYYLMKTFLIPTGDDPEADTSTDERVNNNQKPQPTYNKQTGPSNNKGSQGPKPVSDPQIKKIRAKTKELSDLAQANQDSIIQSLSERFQFGKIEDLSGQTASRVIDQLMKWIEHHQKDNNHAPNN